MRIKEEIKKRHYRSCNKVLLKKDILSQKFEDADVAGVATGSVYVIMKIKKIFFLKYSSNSG